MYYGSDNWKRKGGPNSKKLLELKMLLTKYQIVTNKVNQSEPSNIMN